MIAAPDRSAAATSPWRRFGRNRGARLGLVVSGLMVAACLTSLPYTARHYDEQELSRHHSPPGVGRVADWFGTDELGRSLLVRTLYGGCTSIFLGVLAAGVSVIIGVTWGAVAGYAGGAADGVMMRTVDVLNSLPYILLVMLFTLAFRDRLAGWVGADRATFVVLFLAIGSVSWLTMARVIRGQVLSIRELPYVEAARAMGLPAHRILIRHVVPNLVGPIVVYATLAVPNAILQESFLSFLGIGIQDPQATWGSLASNSIAAINTVQFDWWLVVFPCGALALTLLSLNFVGDGLRDAFDPKSE